MLLIQIRRNTGELDLPAAFPQNPQGLIDLGKALPRLRDAAKANYGIESEVWAETSTGQRIPQEDLDYVLHVGHQERSTQRTRRPDQRRVQRGQGPLKRAAEVLEGLEV